MSQSKLNRDAALSVIPRPSSDFPHLSQISSNQLNPGSNAIPVADRPHRLNDKPVIATGIVPIQDICPVTVDHIDVKITIIIVVAPPCAESVSPIIDPGFTGDIGERTITMVVIQHIGLPSICQIDIQIAIVIAITKTGIGTFIHVAYSCIFRNVGKCPIPVVPIEDVGISIVIPVVAQIEIEITIIIKVPEFRAGGMSGMPEPGHRSHIRECAIPVIAVKNVGMILVPDVEIHIPVVIVIGKGGPCAVSIVIDSRFNSDVDERSISVIFIQCVGPRVV